jgi:pyruvate,water dikinase
VLAVERETGRVLSAKIADKQVYLAAGTGQEQPVAESLRKKSCLSSRDVHRLWELGKRSSEHFGAPQDIEWAFHDGNLFLLQSRPITTHRETEAAEALARATRQRLREEMSAGRGPWVVHNLAETLPHPTALTWSVIRKFMSGLGGFGAMYRQAGFQPAPIIDREGFLELVAGRIYMDAARAPEMFCENFPFAYDLEKLVHDPAYAAPGIVFIACEGRRTTVQGGRKAPGLGGTGRWRIPRKDDPSGDRIRRPIQRKEPSLANGGATDRLLGGVRETDSKCFWPRYSHAGLDLRHGMGGA